MLTRDETAIRLILPQAANARIELYRGSLAPMAGWVSRAFDTRAPTSTIAWRARLTGRAVLRTEIHIQSAPAGENRDARAGPAGPYGA